MTEAAIAANRANAKKSTGPRTAAGKLKSASNAFTHGLYSFAHFEGFCTSQDFALDLVTNMHDHYDPITPIEHMLVAQLIHFEMRFIQMDAYYQRIMARDPDDLIDNPPKTLSIVMRELNALPGRIARLIKTIETERANRANRLQLAQDEFEIEPIEDQPLLPVPPERKPVEKPKNEPKPTYTPGQILFKLFAEQILGNDPDYAHIVNRQPAPQPEAPPSEPTENEAIQNEAIDNDLNPS